MKTLIFLIAILVSTNLFSQDLVPNRGSGGPDSYGYNWIDSDDPMGPTFSWIDISSTGIEITGLVDDGVVGPFDIGFDFPFYGQTKTQFWINSNGCISFNENLLPFANGTIPTGNMSTDFIAWFWDDLNPSDPNSKVYFETIEDSMFVIQFEKYAQYLQQSYFIDAELVIYSNGDILVQYLHIDNGFPLESETIGLQSYDNTLGLMVVNNAPYVHNELALLFDLDYNAVVGMDDISNGNQEMEVFPNPVQSDVSFVFPASNNQRTFVITDLQGRTVHSVNVEKSSEQLELNLSELKPGVYSATLKSQGKERILEIKFVVTR